MKLEREEIYRNHYYCPIAGCEEGIEHKHEPRPNGLSPSGAHLTRLFYGLHIGVLHEHLWVAHRIRGTWSVDPGPWWGMFAGAASAHPTTGDRG